MPNLLPIALLGAVALSACQQTTPTPTPAPDTCNRAQYEAFIGSPASEVDFSGHEAVRIIAPGDAVTMDFRAERLNVKTDADGRIIELTCG